MAAVAAAAAWAAAAAAAAAWAAWAAAAEVAAAAVEGRPLLGSMEETQLDCSARRRSIPVEMAATMGSSTPARRSRIPRDTNDEVCVCVDRKDERREREREKRGR
jgi:hypothetical protein